MKSGGESPGRRRSGVDAGGAAPTGAPEHRQPSSLLLVGTLGTVSVLAGLAIVSVYQWANPRIQAHQAAELKAAIMEVLGEPQRYEIRWVMDGRLLDSLPAGVDSADATPVYPGYDATGRLVGYAIPGQKGGFQDVIHLVFGYDPASDQVIGMTVTENEETPGLGARITTDSAFIDQFRGVGIPLLAVKGGNGKKKPGDIDVITGSTISSTAVVAAINERLDAVKPALRAAVAAGARAPSSVEASGVADGTSAFASGPADGPSPGALSRGKGGGAR